MIGRARTFPEGLPLLERWTETLRHRSPADIGVTRMSETNPMQEVRGEQAALHSTGAPKISALVLDTQQRGLLGLDMVPLLAGEFALLAFLGAQPFTWHSSRRLSVCVYQRDDLGARQLVWKYVSTLRKKLGPVAPGLIELCRQRG